MPERITVEVAYALPQRQWLIALELPHGASVSDAIRRSGLEEQLPEGLPKPLQTGIWGRRCSAVDTLRDGDRVEIYRPLIADPKEARRRRAKTTR
jgi:putative ubiquitin-RnfH superfamily antitoxin RatB of RatAB toxin-antitoxin module